MNTYRRLGRATGAAILAGTSWLGAVVTLAPAAGAEVVSATDAAGDTVTDTIEDPISVANADIVATAADSTPDGITLSFRTAKLVDPAADRNWLSVFTGARWELDTNGDSKRDYVVNYSRDEETQALTADMDKLGPGYPPDDCQPVPSYRPDAGYSVVILPKCLGGATALGYRVLVEYTTNAEDPGADIGTDVSPDEGFAGPVPIILAAGVTPVTLIPPVSTPVAPQQASGAAPSTSTTAPVSGAPEAGTPWAAPGKTVTRPSAGSRSRPTNAAPNVTAPEGTAPDGTAPASAPGLARTGLGDRAVRMAVFALGIGLMGVGLLFANRRPAVRPIPIGRGRRVDR
jgi:hypothetical protein